MKFQGGKIFNISRPIRGRGNFRYKINCDNSEDRGIHETPTGNA